MFIDDLGFADGDATGPRHLRSWLEGGVEARPGNVRLAVTSNRRAIVARHASEQDDPLNPRDAVDDRLALADRFGLSLGFHACSQDEYLAIVRGYAEDARARVGARPRRSNGPSAAARARGGSPGSSSPNSPGGPARRSSDRARGA